MSPLTRFFLRLFVVFVLIFLSVQLFNRFCFFSYKCRPFYFSRYLPRVEGKEKIEMFFKVESHRPNLDFYTLTDKIVTVPNRVHSVVFVAKNTSGKEMKIRPILKVNPTEFKKYLERISCLCAQEYSLKPGQIAHLEMEFFVNSKIETAKDFNNSFGNEVEITYQVE